MHNFIVKTIGILLFIIFSNNNAFSKSSYNKSEWSKRTLHIDNSVIIIKTPINWQLHPVHKEQSHNFYMVEFLPHKQTIKKWNKMITTTVTKKIKLTPKQYFTSLTFLTQKICGKQNTAAQILRESPSELLAILMCGNPSNNPGFGGLKKNQGEMMIYRIYRVGDDIYSIFHSWRGKAFNVTDSSNKGFPTTTKAVGEYILASELNLLCHKTHPTNICKPYLK